MRVVVHVEPYELSDLVHVLEAADFKVSVVPTKGDPVTDDEAEIQLVTRSDHVGVDKTDRLVIGDLMIDLDARVVQTGGTRIDLTTREFDLLCAFVRNANRVLSKDLLVDMLWAHEPVTPNAVEARVSALRKKLGRRDDPIIHTVRGVGYVLRASILSADVRRELLVRQREELVRQREELVRQRQETIARRESSVTRRPSRPPRPPA